MQNVFSIKSKNKIPLISVYLNSKTICQINRSKLPWEKRVSVKLLESRNNLTFEDQGGAHYIHSLDFEKGWLHLSVRVQNNLACQADCIVSDAKRYDLKDFIRGKLKGIRFQPFFITGAKHNNQGQSGKGLFERGFHFSGIITPANVSLSCICDYCSNSFRIKSFHAGFSNVTYFYSGSGSQTLVTSMNVDTAPDEIIRPVMEKVLSLEVKLPLSKDGSYFKYLNAFRCPYCGAPYIDFERFPEQREKEYYGNYFYGDELFHYESDKK